MTRITGTIRGVNTLDFAAVTKAITKSAAGAAGGGEGLTGARPTTMDDVASVAEQKGNSAGAYKAEGARAVDEIMREAFSEGFAAAFKAIFG